MSCASCNNNCGCEQNICNQCQTPEPCECPIVDLSTDCVLYNKEEISCGETVIVPTNTILSNALQLIVSYFCGAIEEVKKYLRLINIGTGAEIYAGDNLLGEKKIRKINSSSDIITITQNPNDISLGIDEDALNDFIEDNQKEYTLNNLGTGEEIAIEPVSAPVGDITTFEFKTIKSNTLMISSTDTEISIESPESSEIQRFIVNKDYAGVEELGTVSKPFKTIENAFTAFVGTGSVTNPEFANAIIFITRASTDYVYTGNLNYNNFILELETGTVINSNPSSGNYLLDFNSLNVLDNIDSTIILNENSNIALTKKGFINDGTTGIYSSYYKILRIKGTGTITALADSTGSPSIKTIFESNYTSTVGYGNPSAALFSVNSINVISHNSPFVMKGGDGALLFENVNFQFCSPITLTMNTATVPFDFKGGEIQMLSCNGLIQIDSLSNIVDTVFKVEELNSSDINIIIRNTEFRGNSNNFLNNVSATEFITFSGVNVNTNLLFLTNKFILSSTSNPQPIELKNSTIGGTLTSMFDVNEMVISTNSVNELGSQVIETLPLYSSKNAAQADGLFTGSAFINRKVITAGSFVPTVEYKISSIGTTDFTLIGASANTVGLYFTATGVGTGTGTADLIVRDILI